MPLKSPMDNLQTEPGHLLRPEDRPKKLVKREDEVRKINNTSFLEGRFPKLHYVRSTMDSDQEEETLQLLETRQRLTEELTRQPYDLILYLERSSVHADLGYPDLAAGDSYRALLLCDECTNEGFEYHELALESLRSRTIDGLPPVLQRHGTRRNHVDLTSGVEALSLDGGNLVKIAQAASIRCYRNLAISLLLCGCLKSAFEFCVRGLTAEPEDEELLQAREYIEQIAKGRLKVDRVDVKDLPDQGLVRREVYPWNHHEPNRFSQESLDFLNAELAKASSNCEVKITELPTLLESTTSKTDEHEDIPTNKQLGLFAKTNIQPDETVLDEFSLLAANNHLKESLCDACSTELPPLTANSRVVGCPECEDMFCNEECLTRAQQEYHPAVCDKEVDAIAKETDPKDKSSALYLLLLARALAMAITQEIHPLDIRQVKYIWGDFLPSVENAVLLSVNAGPPPVWTLPFSFHHNITGPLHVLEKMDIDIFASIENYDLWIFNTLYSKFRGTASGRVNPRNGHPEVAAVHPLWCLANHDCDPNVQWEWGSRMKLWCREKKIGGLPGGIKKGEEILNHYCDIELSVQHRREWAKGSLGGWCMCNRCRAEAAEAKALFSNGI